MGLAQANAFDRAQVYELNVLAELAQRALDAGVQVIVERHSRVPLDEVAAQVQLQKELCKGVPFYNARSACHGHCPWI